MNEKCVSCIRNAEETNNIVVIHVKVCSETLIAIDSLSGSNNHRVSSVASYAELGTLPVSASPVPGFLLPRILFPSPTSFFNSYTSFTLDLDTLLPLRQLALTLPVILLAYSHISFTFQPVVFPTTSCHSPFQAYNQARSSKMQLRTIFSVLLITAGSAIAGPPGCFLAAIKFVAILNTI